MFQPDKISSETKADFYELLLKQLAELIRGETDFIANLANASSLLFYQMENVNWAGFYLMKKNELVLGPFQGRVACLRIQLSKGVCGTAAQEKKTLIVPDVNAFENYIACDAETNSEIVIPLLKGKELLGVLDIDSPMKNRFDEGDRKYLEKFAGMLAKNDVHDV